MPDAPPEKIGSPAAPAATYSSTARKPRRAPSTAPRSSTPKVCRVTGTGPLMLIDGQDRADGDQGGEGGDQGQVDGAVTGAHQGLPLAN